MAKRRGKKPKAEKTGRPPKRVVEHYRALGIRSAGDYVAWCRRRGFVPSVEKSWEDIAREKSEVGRRIANELSLRLREHKDPLGVLKDALSGKVHAPRVARHDLREICRKVQQVSKHTPHRDRLGEFFDVLADRARFLFDQVDIGDRRYHYVDALIALNMRRNQWIRPLEEWRPRSHNRGKQFSSLARHLLARYPVPGFMDSAWFRRDRGSGSYRDWFVHLGSGKNLRTARTPIPLTKRIVHHFLEAPDHYSIESALRFGQVHAWGGGPRLADAISATRIGDGFAREEFWGTVIRFLVDHPMLDPAQSTLR